MVFVFRRSLRLVLILDIELFVGTGMDRNVDGVWMGVCNHVTFHKLTCVNLLISTHCQLVTTHITYIKATLGKKSEKSFTWTSLGSRG